ncbi:hypothetical protein PR202_ga16326 [Eleusine coracana subsp. coracana]|uniref:Uncharacterized protein n=1 Tax=Eleusine coracana subsp. coracana TaxID=191504 RepID=A0AAV5CMI5_ELECO|nr:hypothetical protein PR202_ga16326 [Eleusine coracana subsp. coracana]
MDYGGTMRQLQENLCSLLHHARQESSILKPLKVMVIKDMIYLIHVNGLAEHASPNAGSQSQRQLAFVDLAKSCCKVLTSSNHPFSMFCLMYGGCILFTLLKVVLVQLLSNTEENDNVMDLVSVQDLFSSKFPVDISVNLPVLRPGIPKQKSEFSERTTN